eukprot:EG_transcript_1365
MNVQGVAATLESTFHHDRSIRKQAEETLKQFRGQPKFPQLLLHIIVTDGITEPVKKAAAIFFKNLAKYHWDPREEFHIADADKGEVRSVVLDCMINCKSSQLRTILSDAIARICEFDFPQQWPDVVPALVAKFTTTQDLNVINGALYTGHSIFKRYRADMELTLKTQQELLAIISQFGPPLLDLVEKTTQSIPQNAANKATLEQLFAVLNLSIEIFYDLNCLDIGDWFLSTLTRFMTAFLTLMSCSFPALESADDDVPGLLDENKALILQCITLCLEKFDEDFKPYVEKFTTSVWELLQRVSPKPKHDQLCISAMAFLTGVSRTIYHNLLADIEKQKMICEKIIIPNIELREVDIEMFEDDPTEYIRRDIEGSDSDTRRRSACDLIQGLSKNYEQTVTDIFQRYVAFLTQLYGQNPDDWKRKDTAMYLVTALTVRGATTQHGTRRINDMVNIGDFFQGHVVPELQDPACPNAKYPVLKADAIKFVSSFRLQIPKDRYPQLLQLLANWVKSPNPVVHSYSATAIDHLLTARDEHGQLRLTKAEWKDLAGVLLQNLFQTLQSSKEENEYIMKAIMRVILMGQENLAGFVAHILPILTSILSQVSRNPQHPTFNHYLFESISGLVKFNPSNLTGIEQAIMPTFTEILSSDTAEFMPYVFQILAQMMEQHPQLTPQHMALFAPLLTPVLYENKGNIPALVRLVRVYLQKAPAQIVAAGQLNPTLGVFQYLVSSKLYDHEGFNLLNTIIGYFPREHLADMLKTILTLLFTRLMNSRTSKFVKCLIIFFSLFVVKLGADTLVQTVEAIQPGGGLWKQVFLNVWLREMQKVSGKNQRKLCSVALTKLLTESSTMLSDACFAELWSPALLAALKMLELGEEQDDEKDQYANRHVVTVEQLKDQEQGYMNAFCPLQCAQRPEEDPCADVPDERAQFAHSVQRLQATPHGPKCAAAARALPPDVQAVLRKFAPSFV